MKKLIFLALLLLLVASNAQATIKFEYKQGDDGFDANLFDLTNVHFDGTTTGETIFGTVQIGSTSELVKFISNEPIQGSEGQGNGQATLFDVAENGFNYLQILMDNPTLGFDAILFSIKSADQDLGDQENDVSLVGIDQFGNSFNYSQSIKRNSENWFLVYGVTPEIIKSLTITSVTGVVIDSLKHVRIDPSTGAVPEPTTMLLFGAGLAGLAAVGRRRKDA